MHCFWLQVGRNMFRGAITILTMIGLLGHAVFGCCWHHGDCVDSACADSCCSSVKVAEETVAVSSNSKCSSGCCSHSHRRAVAEKKTVAEKDGRYQIACSDEAPAPVPHSPCSHGRCTYLGVADVETRLLGERFPAGGLPVCEFAESKRLVVGRFLMPCFLCRPAWESSSSQTQIWLL